RLSLIEAEAIRLFDHRRDELRAGRADHGGAEREHHAEDRHADADGLAGRLASGVTARVTVRMAAVSRVLDVVRELVQIRHVRSLRPSRSCIAGRLPITQTDRALRPRSRGRLLGPALQLRFETAHIDQAGSVEDETGA